MQVRLRFSTITSIEADVLLVDESIGAADSEFNERAAARLDRFYAGSGTLVISSHSQNVLDAHCSKFVTLANGQAMLTVE